MSLEDSAIRTFHCNITTETMPPSLETVTSQIQQFLPQNARVLQWAIVKTELEDGKLWIEGSYYATSGRS